MINGALIEAVERLAEMVQDKQAAAREALGVESQSVKVGEFDGELVEKLYVVFGDAVGTWHDGIRAILTELAKMPVELPTDSDVMGAWTSGFIANGGNKAAMYVARMIRSRLAPTIAAKDARIADLERQLATALEERDNARGELSSRLAMPVDASGKTPGQVDYEAYGVARFGSAGSTPWHRLTDAVRTYNEIGAQAVLAAFGTGAESLRNVRAKIIAAPGEAAEYYARLVDDELAKVHP
jgi:hypothetical protein